MSSTVTTMVLTTFSMRRLVLVHGFATPFKGLGLAPQSGSRLYSSASVGGGRVSTAAQDQDLLEKMKSASNPTKLDTQPPKGTRDFYPEDMRLRKWLFEEWRAVARQFAFSEYDAPVLESEALYTRKAGEEVTQQLYNFVDKGERNVALRPEMTPSLARMVLAKKGALPLPLKWFSIPQCWRYERMTRGRRREHFQWNMDIWGVKGTQAEVELVKAMVQFFENVGLSSEDVGIKVNSRLVISEVLTDLGIPEDKFAATCVLVDKLEKVPIDAIQDELIELGLNVAVIEELLDVLSNKSFEALEERLGASSLAVQELREFMSLCDAYDMVDWIVFDASVVRGLSYYTGIVFEAFDRQGTLRAIAGGGRYDKLLESFGGSPTPAVGFGFGDAVIVELLKERELLPSFDSADVDVVVASMSPDQYGTILSIATRLRSHGIGVDVVLEEKKPKWIFKHADRLGATHCLVVGDREIVNGEVGVKHLESGEQTSVKLDDLESWAETYL